MNLDYLLSSLPCYYLRYAILPLQSVSMHCPLTFSPSKGIALPFVRNSSERISYSFSRLNIVKSEAALFIPKRSRGAVVISFNKYSRLKTPSSTSFVYSSGNAVSSPTMPKLLSLRPRFFSSSVCGAWWGIHFVPAVLL